MGVLESGDPFGGGGEQDPVAGLGGLDAQADGEVGLAGAGWAEEDDVLGLGQEVPVARWAMRSSFSDGWWSKKKS